MTWRTATAAPGSRRKNQRGSLPLSLNLWALLMIAAQFALRWPGTRDSWFYSDDLLFLSDIGAGIDDPAWFFRSHFGHRMPISFLLTEQVANSGPYNWQAAAVQIVVLQAIAAVAVWIMLRVLFGARPLLLIPFGLYLFSSAGAAASTWWAVAINQLPHQIAFAGAVAAHVVYLRTRRRRWLVLACLFLLLGYGTYTKTVLLPFVLLFLTVTYFCTGSMGSRIRQTVRRDLLAWIVYGTISAGYVVVYILTSADDGELALGPNTIRLVVDHLAITTPTTLAGGPWDWRVWLETSPAVVAAPPLWLLVAGWLVLAGIVAASSLRRRHATVALVMPVGYLLISLIFIVQSRSIMTTIDGPEIVSHQVQYLADFVLVASLALALMLMPLRQAIDPSRPRDPVLLHLPWTRAIRVTTMVVILASLSAVTVVSNVRFAESWRGDWDQRRFFTTAISEIETHRPLLADTVVPDTAISPLFTSYTAVRTMLSPVSDQFTTADVGTNLQMLTEDGHLSQATVSAGNRMIDPPENCRTITRDGGWIEITPTLDYTLWTAVDLVTTTPTEIEFAFGPRHATATVPAGDQTLLVSTEDGYHSAWIRPEIGTTICVKAIRVGELVPRSDR